MLYQAKLTIKYKIAIKDKVTKVTIRQHCVLHSPYPTLVLVKLLAYFLINNGTSGFTPCFPGGSFAPKLKTYAYIHLLLAGAQPIIEAEA